MRQIPWVRSVPHRGGIYFVLDMHANNVHGSNILCNTKVIRETGGFDVHMPDGEDTDLGYRLLRKGFKIYFIDNIVCRHTVQPSMKSLIRRAFSHGCAGSLLLMKYRKLKLQDLAFSALLLIGFLFWVFLDPKLLIWLSMFGLHACMRARKAGLL